ncbi:pyrroline-5-carboxylate reductase [Fictibacillus phosphorivorans]|uniref:pyrroline-5-carboxylate reductase n=1 Tax=Fictibacillus phosphorivorans TaxID=1221500 RepID=UPI0012CBB93D|nr:pyrroline-5-carboxylate reductase [Fictibacillus phosphorivorans]MQR95679.1 pyrroline-5-carboxylate reductase [Fictibacillus phosphorivorans]
MGTEKITFIGAGSMAEAIMEGLIKKEKWQADLITIKNRSNTQRVDELRVKYGVVPASTIEEAVAGADIIILAVKPKDAHDAVNNIKPFVKSHQLILSVMAGISTETLTDWLHLQNPIVRAMPNTSASIGYSATALSSGKFAMQSHIEKSLELFETIGTVTLVPEEKLHIVTGLSGSGPAYVYYIAEAMQKAAEELNLSEEEAKTLISQTLLGASLMLKQTTDSPIELRRKVTSPGGTTEAGIGKLDQFGVHDAFLACIKRAVKRSEELGRLN